MSRFLLQETSLVVSRLFEMWEKRIAQRGRIVWVQGPEKYKYEEGWAPLSFESMQGKQIGKFVAQTQLKR